jgi:hypothetical protein
VNAWTIQTREQAGRLAGVGVDGLMVDEPVCCRS